MSWGLSQWLECYLNGAGVAKLFSGDGWRHRQSWIASEGTDTSLQKNFRKICLWNFCAFSLPRVSREDLILLFNFRVTSSGFHFLCTWMLFSFNKFTYLLNQRIKEWMEHRMHWLIFPFMIFNLLFLLQNYSNLV